MSFDETIAAVNRICLTAFGQSFLFTRAGETESQSVTGILESGVEPEEAAPGDGSTYALLWLESGDIDPPAAKGDEIESATTVYKIVRIEQDAGGGLRMLLRQDRAV